MRLRWTLPAAALAACAAWTLPAPANAAPSMPTAGIAAGLAQNGNMVEPVQYRRHRHYRPHHWRGHRHCWVDRQRVRTPSGRVIVRSVRRCR